MTARAIDQTAEPVAATGPRPPAARPLAGSAHVWFDRVRAGPDSAWQHADTLDPGPLDRLTRQRPDLCGLRLDCPRIMGILNLTPDSFSDGGDLVSVTAAVDRAREMAVAGADILDIGGESTRPGATEVPVADEIARTAPAIAAIRTAGIATPISIDTRKAAVAEAALDAGADMVNDVSAMGFDPDMAPLLAERGVPVCLMHAQGRPETMQDAPRYADVVGEIAGSLAARIEAAAAAGIDPARVVIDPGIGFGKTLAHNTAVLRRLSVYHGLGPALLLGVSRKGFIGTLGHAAAPKDRLAGSLAVALHGIDQGVQIVRVHDVRETRQAVDLHLAMKQAGDMGADHDT